MGAGYDTTASFIQSLVLALVNFPEPQRLAQEEIDRVIGDERVPLLDDIERLPYVQAFIKEVSILRCIDRNSND
jgi:cytochrome P450